MSHGGEKSPRAKTLSAEVEPFVPSHNPPGSRTDPLAAGDSVTAISTAPQQQQVAPQPALQPGAEVLPGMHSIGDLPAYMTNCYPFVQDPSAPDVRWQAGAPTPGSLHQHPYPSYSPHPEFYTAAPPPVYPGYYPGYPINPFGGYQPHQLPPTYPQPYLHKQGGVRQNKQQGHRQNKNNRRKHKNQSSDCKSVGVQKTASGEKVIIPSKDIKKKTKTVIFVDVSQQTDFPEDLASQSLSERPSTFRKTKAKNRRKTQSQQTRRPNVSSTDSEVDEAQVDSDSGYSSPKHCRNLSAGSTQGIVTQDAATGTAIASNKTTPSGAHSSDKGNSQAAMSSTGVKPMSYAGIVAKPVSTATSATDTTLNNNERTSADDVAQQSTAAAARQANKNKTTGNVQRNRSSQRVGEVPDRNEIVSPTDTLNSSVGSSVSNDALAKKKKRQRKRNKSKDSGKSANSSSNSIARSEMTVTPVPSAEELGALRFEDDMEYPDLPSSSGTQSSIAGSVASNKPLKYSMVVQQTPVHEPYKPLSQEPVPMIEEKKKILPEDLMSPEAAVSGVKDGKNAKKRRKKALLATQAAAQEYSEITAEQKQLHENLKKPHKRTKMPIAFDLGDMLAALELQQKQEQRNKQQTKSVHMAAPVSTTMGLVNVASTGAKPKRKEQFGVNPLDSNAPIKRGKEKEGAAKKKPSTLKRVILREREEKKRMRILGECALSDDDSTKPTVQSENAVMDEVGLSQLSQDGISDKGSSVSLSQSQSELSPVSQMSPMSMSPLSPGSPLSSGLPSPIVGLRTPSPSAPIPNIHSRRFREYCNQMLDKDIDACCTTLLQTLCRFHDRQYHKDPTKAKSKRRLVMGLREVTKHLRLKKIKCVVISPNLERIQSRGGLDDALDAIISLANDNNVPFIFALGRKALGRAVNKLVPVSVVGIFNYDGAEDTFRDLLELSKKAREAYAEMIQKYQQEMEAQTAARISKHHHHMGHNRNLSNCSGISFSSVISEPISENYPVPEPEVDEYGREIEATSQPDIDAALAESLQVNSDPTGKTVTTEVLNSYDDTDLTVTRTDENVDLSFEETKVDNDLSDEEEEEEDDGEDDDGICDKEQEVCESSFKSTNNERIVSWVAEAQSCIGSLKITDIENECDNEAVNCSDLATVVENGCHDDTLIAEKPSQEDHSCSQSNSLAS
ncbi:selenocysteine insertion sequence-binding protein 2-like [Ptychodera flava]|uniref:selenocysteine insertion sequence-binding protein 2-like n=1 Tax=Ptychodera flava TaxID=63121 RepID=UPI003969C55C